jgi:ankyrin repeat protein
MKAVLHSLAEVALIVVMVAVVWSDPGRLAGWLSAVSAEEQLLSSSCVGDDAQFDDALRRGASVAACDTSGMTALHYAAASGDADLVRRLIALGADVDAPSNSGLTPLASAAIGDHPDVAQILLREGAAPTDDVVRAARYAMAERTERVLCRWRDKVAAEAEQ